MGTNYSVNNFLAGNYSGWAFWCKVGKDGEAPCLPQDIDTFAAVWLSPANATAFVDLKPGRWRLFYADTKDRGDFADNLTATGRPVGAEFDEMAQGGVYALTLFSDPHQNTTNNGTENVKSLRTVVVSDNSVSILWQIPQYVVITAAEILFSITGLEFSYSQAPSSMKSVLQATWLLTVAGGDFIDFALAEAHIFRNPAYELLLFAGLMVVVVIIFALIAIFWYEYSDYEQRSDDPDTKAEDKQTLVVSDDEDA